MVAERGPGSREALNPKSLPRTGVWQLVELFKLGDPIAFCLFRDPERDPTSKFTLRGLLSRPPSANKGALVRLWRVFGPIAFLVALIASCFVCVDPCDAM